MTPNEVVYQVNQEPALVKIWRELTTEQKRKFIDECEDADSQDLDRLIREIADGKRRLF